jgi:hypothetical protein
MVLLLSNDKKTVSKYKFKIPNSIFLVIEFLFSFRNIYFFYLNPRYNLTEIKIDTRGSSLNWDWIQ